MAACGSLQHIFEKPLPENSSVFEPLSTWSPIKSMSPIDNASFNEIFGEIDFKENNDHGESSNTPPSSSSLYPASPPSSVSSSSSSSFTNSNNHQLGGIESLFRDNNEKNKTPYYPKKQYRHKDSFSSMSSEGLSHCTEGLGFESSDEVEEHGNNDNISLDWRHRREEKQGANVIQERSEYIYCDHRRSRVNKKLFPPPISCIGGNGKPFVNFKSYRENGRFILKEVRIPQQEFLRASRENGRLKLELVSSDDEYFEEDDDDDDDENFDLKDIKEVDEDVKEVDEDIKEVDEDIKEEDYVNEEEFYETNVDGEEQDQINNDNEEN